MSVTPIHKKRRERGETPSESQSRTFSENKRTDRPADFPNYSEFAKPSRPRHARSHNYSGDRGDQNRNYQDRESYNRESSNRDPYDRSQYKDAYTKQIDYDSHANRMAEMQYDHREQRRQYKEAGGDYGHHNVVSYKQSDDGYSKYQNERGYERDDYSHGGQYDGYSQGSRGQRGDGYGRGDEDYYNSRNRSSRY